MTPKEADYSYQFVHIYTPIVPRGRGEPRRSPANTAHARRSRRVDRLSSTPRVAAINRFALAGTSGDWVGPIGYQPDVNRLVFSVHDTYRVPVNGYTSRMPTRHPRIQVPRDPDLDRAIARGRALLGPGTPSSQVVHALAVRGATALEQDRQAEEQAREFLLTVADGASGLDLESLRSVRDRAWR